MALRAWREEKKDKEIVFAENNPFMEEKEPETRAKELIENGRIDDAILALEAEVQKNPDNASAWRLLGQLHQENDEDDKAIVCLLVSERARDSRRKRLTSTHTT